MFNRRKKEDAKDILIKKLEDRVQGMSEIINDFEKRIFAVDVYDIVTLISNAPPQDGALSSEIVINITKQEDILGALPNEISGKKIEFTLKHPRTYY